MKWPYPLPIAQSCIRLNKFDAVRHFYKSPLNLKTQSNPIQSSPIAHTQTKTVKPNDGKEKLKRVASIIRATQIYIWI